MMTQDPFIEIAMKLSEIRQQAKTRQKFPQELWEAIISLAKTHSPQEISKRLNINPSYLKRKIQDCRSIKEVDFQEISAPNFSSDRISIELFSDFGLRARIQGPPSCLNFLDTLFKR